MISKLERKLKMSLWLRLARSCLLLEGIIFIVVMNYSAYTHLSISGAKRCIYAVDDQRLIKILNDAVMVLGFVL